MTSKQRQHRPRQLRLAAGEHAARRRGMVLVIVLVVVALLALAAYTFAELMATHYGAALLNGKQVQTRVLVESGVEAVRMYLMSDEAARLDVGGHFNNPTYFQAIPVVTGTDASQQGDFTVVVPNIDDEGNLAGVRYGLEDESARLNINALVELDKLQGGAGRDLLMGLPGMTEDVADAIMDWMDSDDEPREYGCEAEYYQQLTPAYYTKNGPLETVEELLLVRGVTPQLLFGADTNRNGMVDAHEMDQLSPLGAGASGAASGVSLGSSGLDSSLGSLDRGWSGYLTLYGQEKNTNSLGQPRIDLNMDDLEMLYEQLATALNEDWAKFIVLYRQYGPYDGSEAGTDVALAEVNPSQAGQQKFTQVLDLIGAKVQVGGNSGGSGGSGSGSSGSGSGGGGGGGEEEATIVGPVFPDSTVEMMLYMPLLMDAVTVVTAETIPGRINVNQAPVAILLGIPGMEEEMVQELLTARATEPADENEEAAFKHETWLLTSGIVTLDQMKALSPFVCAGGDVYRAQIVGYYEDGSASSRAEVVFDATGAVPRILSYRDISHLGRGYPLDLLGLRMAAGGSLAAPAMGTP